MRCGSASNSSGTRTSINVGHFGVPMRRTNLSTEMVFGACIGVPFSRRAERDASACASWGDRSPHVRVDDLHLSNVKTNCRFGQKPAKSLDTGSNLSRHCDGLDLQPVLVEIDITQAERIAHDRDR